ncbi:MAG: FtsQ-type POTRA domain-containing protein, partial [Clostridia bacterium]|nr:FtsQ-type POTRA domain-containing protein [Clostridia bacterium]
GDNLFLINRDKVREHITQKLPYIGDVSVKLKLPNKIIITVYETSALCAVHSGDSYILLNENGKVLSKVPSLEDVYTYGILENGYELDRADVDEAFGEEETTTEAPENTEAAETEDAQTSETGEEEKEGSGEMVYATPAGNVAQSPQRKEETPDPVYVLYDKEVIALDGVKIKNATVGKTVEFDNEKTLAVYSEIMNLFIENSIKGITELNLKDIYNIVMKYENRIDVKVGSVTNLESKMAFAAQVIKEQDAVSPDQMGIIDLTIDKKAYFQPVTTTKPTTTVAETTDPAEAETETTTEGETEEKATNSAGEEIQVARTTQKSQENP